MRVLHLDGESPVHRLSPEVKIASVLSFTIVVVLTPRTGFAAFGGFAALIAIVAALARIPPLWLLKRATIELPFVLLAIALPIFGAGDRVDWLGLSLSVDGLLGAWNIFAKGTLGVLASLLLAATTPMRDLITGLDRLRCPAVLTQIMMFMLRYIDVLAGDARRMRIARISRGYDPRFLWQAKAFAVGVGSLFLRSYERGERVYLAMLSRGWTGRMPSPDRAAAPAREWALSSMLPVAAAGIALALA
ncbi:cobalt ECF transporter T component CbiQ [Actinoplanes sp. G11-F43]|uniref:cobalt ECF transporter T component CbiQ n=1 Tax=Actinoplanes sp. G11-F43 TaxID=3424130 RepID=UPI003D3457A3